MKHLHLHLNYRLVIVFAFILLFTFVARAQDVPVDAPPIVEAPVTTDTDNQLIEALLKMFGLTLPLSPVVTAIVTFLKTALPSAPSDKIVLVVSGVSAVLYYFVRRAGITPEQAQGAMEWIINAFLPALLLIFGSSTMHEVSAKINVPVLGYKRN